MLHEKIKSSAIILGSSQVASAALRFVRVVIIARVLSPEDFGVAATFWITTGVLMAITEMGIEKIIIQDDKGDDVHFGSVAQLLLIARGILLAVVILVFAHDIATFFDVPEATGEFRLLALLPLMVGLQHRDLIRKQRVMDFKPLVLHSVMPEFLITLLAFPVAVYFQDYRAFVYLSIVSGIVRVIISHRMADHSFSIAWDKSVVIKSLRFGWPLMINGILMLLTLQGDKFVISQFYSKEELGLFVIAFGFATMVPNSLGRVTAQIALPYLSPLKDNRDRLTANLGYFNRILLLISIAAIVVIFFHGELITRIIYGERYLDATVLIKILTLVYFIRLMRQVPNTLAIVHADTWMIMVSNIVRQLALVLALTLAFSGVELMWIAATGLAGELMAYLAIAVLHRKKRRYSLSLWLWPLAALVGIAAFLAPIIASFDEYEYFFFYFPVSLLVVMTFAFMVWKYLNEQIVANRET